ncbi:DUF2157 domain-containing protein [Candidatus Nomurabacteria bacterium]|nr:DUF2157 domain-containing protein [Candidatus Nomurabacteria bacterium]
MNKDELLAELVNKINTGEISKSEIANRFGLAFSARPESVEKLKKFSSFSLTKLLYVLGAIIAVVGMVLFAYRIWDYIGSFGRIAITLGLGLLLTAIGSFLYKRNPQEAIGTVFHFIGGLLIPGGAVVALNELNPDVSTFWPFAFAFGVIFLFYLFINYIHKNAILTFFTIANGTAFVYLAVMAITGDMPGNYTNLYAYLTMLIGACYILLAYSFRGTWNGKLVPALNFFGFVGVQCAVFAQYLNSSGGGNNSVWPVIFSLGLIFIFYLFLNYRLKHPGLTFITIVNGTAFLYVLVQELIGGSYYANGEIYAYLTMVIGMVYLLLSYSFRDGWNNKLVDILNFFGITGLLGAAFSQIYDSLLWQLFFPILVIGGFVFSIYIKSRVVLIISTLFLLAYIAYITSEYFADSVGWPISLVILGFIFIGLGYVSININKKYISNEAIRP